MASNESPLVLDLRREDHHLVVLSYYLYVLYLLV